jgi:hypothetical protein
MYLRKRGIIAERLNRYLLDGTARSAHRAETSTSDLCEASFGDEVGSRALQDAVVHCNYKIDFYAINNESML